jgi:hypothetical protein
MIIVTVNDTGPVPALGSREGVEGDGGGEDWTAGA